MHHQLLVRRRHRFANLGEEPQAARKIELVLVAVDVEVISLDQLHGKPGPAIGGEAAVENVGDAGVLEARQNAALALETGDLLGSQRAKTGAFEDLERHPLLELFVGSFGEVDHCHTTLAKLRDNAVGAEALAGGQAAAWPAADFLPQGLTQRAGGGFQRARRQQPLEGLT